MINFKFRKICQCNIFCLLSLQPYLCESFYVLLEYARTVMFHWFFIEGLHLHNVLTINVFPSTGGRRYIKTYWSTNPFLWQLFGYFTKFYKFNWIFFDRLYYVIGWCVPALLTIAWGTGTGLFVDTECWRGCNFSP